MRTSDSLISKLENKQSMWLITGASGFIGSHLVEALLELGQHVVGLDNLSTGNKDNLVEVQKNAATIYGKSLNLLKVIF